MLRTNSKKAIENIRQYVISNYDPSNYDLPTETEFPKIAKQILGCFFHEVGKHKRWNESYLNSFTDWCQGLPSIIDTCYYYNRSAVDDLGAILEETEEEKAKYSEEDAEKLLTLLIYRELDNAFVNTFHCDIWDIEEV